MSSSNYISKYEFELREHIEELKTQIDSVKTRAAHADKAEYIRRRAEIRVDLLLPNVTDDDKKELNEEEDDLRHMEFMCIYNLPEEQLEKSLKILKRWYEKEQLSYRRYTRDAEGETRRAAEKAVADSILRDFAAMQTSKK
jgi:hypothetical protein